MAKARYIKRNEARILVYLNTASSVNRYAKQISRKLNIDYCYTLTLLGSMHAKTWLHKVVKDNRAFYTINKAAPMIKAREELVK